MAPVLMTKADTVRCIVTAAIPAVPDQPRAAVYVDARAWNDADIPHLLRHAGATWVPDGTEVEAIVLPFSREVDALEFIDAWLAADEATFLVDFVEVWLFAPAAGRWDRRNLDVLGAGRDQQ